MSHAYRSVRYVDGGIFIEADIHGRLHGTTSRWGHLAKGVLGINAINLEKLGE